MLTVLSPMDLLQMAHFFSSVMRTLAFLVLMSWHLTFYKSISLRCLAQLSCRFMCSEPEMIYVRKLYRPSSALPTVAFD